MSTRLRCVLLGGCVLIVALELPALVRQTLVGTPASTLVPALVERAALPLQPLSYPAVIHWSPGPRLVAIHAGKRNQD